MISIYSQTYHIQNTNDIAKTSSYIIHQYNFPNPPHKPETHTHPTPRTNTAANLHILIAPLNHRDATTVRTQAKKCFQNKLENVLIYGRASV